MYQNAMNHEVTLLVLLLLHYRIFSAQYSTGRPLPRGALVEDEDLEPPHIVADKADLFLAYATVPGYM